MAREVSQEGIELIKKWEGLRLKVYADAVGKATIGYGHLIVKNEDFSAGITLGEAEELLAEDVARTAAGVEAALQVEVNDCQFAALTSFAYNLGVRALAKSTLMALVNKGDMEGASDQFPRWCRAGGVILKGLLNRRLEEQDMFESE